MTAHNKATYDIHRDTTSPAAPNSYAPEVKTMNDEDKWYGNSLRFPTWAEAEANVQNLQQRWLLVTETRVVPSDDAPNYNWIDASLVEIKKEQQT